MFLKMSEHYKNHNSWRVRLCRAVLMENSITQRGEVMEGERPREPHSGSGPSENSGT